MPCRLLDRGAGGNTVESLDAEYERLKEVGRHYLPHLETVLSSVSRMVMDPIVARGIARLVVEKSAVINAGESEGARDAAVELGKEVTLRLMPPIDLRESLQFFENYMLPWDTMKDVLWRMRRGFVSQFETQDPRELVALYGGPGRKGASTLGERMHDEQRGTRGFTSERTPAKPGDK